MSLLQISLTVSTRFLVQMIGREHHSLIQFLLIMEMTIPHSEAISMTKLTGWQFECVNTTCCPFRVFNVPTISNCQAACLCEVQCKALHFYVPSSTCAMFNSTPNPIGNMLADINMTTMIISDAARMALGQYIQKKFGVGRSRAKKKHDRINFSLFDTNVNISERRQIFTKTARAANLPPGQGETRQVMGVTTTNDVYTCRSHRTSITLLSYD